MIDFDDFQDDVRLFILAVLWCMPWASAKNIGSVSRFSHKYVRKCIKSLKDEGYICGAPIGRAFGKVERFALYQSGVDEVRAQYHDPPDYPHSGSDLRRHSIAIENLEVLYEIASIFWADMEDFHLQRPVRIETAAGERIEAPDLREMKLKSFLWCRGNHIQALAMYRSETREGEIIVPMMDYGTHQRPIPSGKELFAGLRFEGEISEFTRPWEDPIENAHPMTIALVVPDAFSAFLVDRSNGNLATVAFDESGKRLNHIRVRKQVGRYVPPYVIRRPADMGGDLNAALDDCRKGKYDLGELDMKVFRLVYRWRAVEHSDLVKCLGPTNGSRIRKVADSLIDRGWIGERNDIYHLGEVGTVTQAIVDRVPLEQARERASFLHNGNGSVSARKLARASRVTWIGLLLQESGIPTALGRRLDLSVLVGNYLDLDPHFPDLYIGVRGGEEGLEWRPLEYVDAKINVQQVREQLRVHWVRHNRGKPWTEGDPPAAYIVTGNAGIEATLLAAHPDLPMSVILFEELVTQCVSGRDPGWRQTVPAARASQSSGTAEWSQAAAPQPATPGSAPPKQPEVRPSRPAAKRQAGRTSESSPGPVPDPKDRPQVAPEPQRKRSFRQKMRRIIIGEPKRSR